MRPVSTALGSTLVTTRPMARGRSRSARRSEPSSPSTPSVHSADGSDGSTSGLACFTKISRSGGTRRVNRVTYVYAFDHKHRKPPMSLKDLLGGKGANLAEMTSVLGLPVPPGFTITTDACRDHMQGGWPHGLDAEVAKHVKALEKAMGKHLGDPGDPLLVSVRSGAKFSM